MTREEMAQLSAAEQEQQRLVNLIALKLADPDGRIQERIARRELSAQPDESDAGNRWPAHGYTRSACAPRTQHNSDAAHWTLQQFSAGPTGEPWYALQKHTDAGVIWGTTGYRDELEAVCKKHGITPQELEPITEEEYYRRCRGE